MRKKTKVQFIYQEEKKINFKSPTNEQLKEIFNQKYFNYLQKRGN